jgi:hypothetical protein
VAGIFTYSFTSLNINDICENCKGIEHALAVEMTTSSRDLPEF